MAADDKITIHGDQWDRAYVKGQVEWCRTREWHRQPWTPSQNPQHNRRVSPHEHCMICQWDGFDSDYGLTAKGQLSAEQFRRQRPRGNKRKIISSLREILSEALEFNRSEARKAAEDNYTEELVTV
jgi:hypothetical protein